LSISLLAIKLNHAPANKKELVQDLIVKAKQIEYLIQSLPVPEPEEQQVRRHSA
jgi:mediator of RNA polymerase II transcription subunit 21